MLPADKQVFPNLDVVGWYTTGSEITEADMQIHRKVSPALVSDPSVAGLGGSLSNPCTKQRPRLHPNSLQVMELNESPVLLLFNTRIDALRKDLPILLYESGGFASLPAVIGFIVSHDTRHAGGCRCLQAC